ncbi:MAG: hypothetical protein ABEJ05_12390 [Haloglomus sp.]
MTRSRWTRPLSAADDSDGATVTRVVGDHELAGAERRRRYEVRLHGVAVDPDDVHSGDADVDVTETDGDTRLSVVVPDGAGVARVRLPVAGTGAWAAFRLPGPTLGEQCIAATRGDEGAALAVRDAAPVGDPLALGLACGAFLGPDALVDLLGTLAAADDAFADRLHAVRYDLLRSLAIAPSAAVDTGESFEAVVAGFDALDAIGDVEAVDALADVVAVCHDSVAETRRFLDGLGYDLGALERRDDGRFAAAVLAHAARTEGVGAAMAHANRRTRGDVDYAEAKRRAESADYWERGAAWRALVGPAARRERREFAYVLANACYWSGEVSRSDSRLAELLHAGAAAAAATIDLDWIVGRARFQRHRAAGHRHRSSQNHALALARFENAASVAEKYPFLDPAEPRFSRAVVRSNQLARRDDIEGAIDVLEEAADRVRESDLSEERRSEMLHHLDGQRHERTARLARGDAADRRDHLAAAAEHYRAIGFERSAERVEAKLADVDPESAEAERHRAAEVRGAPLAPRAHRDVAPAEIPDLEDFLTEPAPEAVGSPDPGVLPDERGGPDPEREPRGGVDDGWY